MHARCPWTISRLKAQQRSDGAYYVYTWRSSGPQTDSFPRADCEEVLIFQEHGCFLYIRTISYFAPT
jgi:hypothetical protein